jgi:hypothetical protein
MVMVVPTETYRMVMVIPTETYGMVMVVPTETYLMVMVIPTKAYQTVIASNGLPAFPLMGGVKLNFLYPVDILLPTFWVSQ